ncbi:alpha/beta fold hydrolase [Actinophytocola sediminis]
MTSTNERFIRVNDVELCVQTIGEPANPPMLLIGNSMLTWPNELCAELAAGRRFVVRYDLRDTGRSTTVDPDAPTYTLRDLVADAAGLLAALGQPHAHVVGYGPGGWIAQLLALDYPDLVASLTLIAARAVAPGPVDADLPDHAPEMMARLFGAPQPDWSDRAAVIDYLVEMGRIMAGAGRFDDGETRESVTRIFERTVDALPAGVDPATMHRSNQMSTVFAALDSGDRWRERLSEITAPTLVVHGETDPFFPIGNGEALAKEIPNATLLRLPETGQGLPRRIWGLLVPALLHLSE